MKQSVKINKKILTLLISVSCVLFGQFCIVPMTTEAQGLNKLKYKTLQDYFRYNGDNSIIVSGHRGGIEKFYPENCIESFENIVCQIPVFFEIDPRLTKDSVIVLMHDAKLDRTSTGKGKLIDYTWKELQSVRLKDNYGNITSYKIPKLEKVIRWSKGKTIINLDEKDVPKSMIVSLIKKYNATGHVMVTVHDAQEAKYYFDRIPNIMMSAFILSIEAYNEYAATGIPWENFIAYVGPVIGTKNKEVVDSLHRNGVRCMIAFGPNHDKMDQPEERRKAYIQEINRNPDIIESNYPIEVWKAIQMVKSSL